MMFRLTKDQVEFAKILTNNSKLQKSKLVQATNKTTNFVVHDRVVIELNFQLWTKKSKTKNSLVGYVVIKVTCEYFFHTFFLKKYILNVFQHS